MEQQFVSSSPHPLFEPLITAEETAVHLRCHLKTVQKMAREGRIPSIRRGKRHFFRLSEVDDWLRTMHTHAQPTLPVN
jgi:excisionase family DNA binding protein